MKNMEKENNQKANGLQETFRPSESFIAYGNLVTFLLLAGLILLGLSGFGWAGYAFVFCIYIIFINSLLQRKILLSKYADVPSAGFLIIKGTRAVFISGLIVFVLTVILLLIHTNLMELIIIPDASFKYKINFVALIIGLPIGVVVGLLSIKFTSYWEQISVQNYNSIISGK